MEVDFHYEMWGHLYTVLLEALRWVHGPCVPHSASQLPAATCRVFETSSQVLGGAQVPPEACGAAEASPVRLCGMSRPNNRILPQNLALLGTEESLPCVMWRVWRYRVTRPEGMASAVIGARI